MSRFQFVADNSATFEVKRLCELVEVTRSSFYAWQASAPAREQRAAADAELVERIRKVHEQDNTCGAPRITAELNDGAPEAERVNHKRVARVMRSAGIVGYVKKRKVRTTVPEPSGQKVPDLLKRDFTADADTRRRSPTRRPAPPLRCNPLRNHTPCPRSGGRALPFKPLVVPPPSTHTPSAWTVGLQRGFAFIGLKELYGEQVAPTRRDRAGAAWWSLRSLRRLVARLGRQGVPGRSSAC